MRNIFFLFSILLSAVAWATTPATNLENYYVSISGKAGDAIVTNLHDQIDGHTTISYSGLEPYYAQTDLTADGKIWDMYSTCSFTTKDANCSQKQVCDCWNKEHSIPQSWFNEASPMKSDLFHVVPTDARVNNFRGNLPYGETSSTAYIDNDSHSLGHKGSSNFNGYSGTVYEPDDEYKGDFARTYMYMVVRYMDKNFTQKDNGSVMFAYNSGATIKNTFTTYSVNLLMKWHREDPVSQKEIDRNNAVYGIQHNRNPFIDYPYLAEYIWGEKKGERFSLDQVISAYDSEFELGVSDGSRVSTDPVIVVPTAALTLGPALAGETATRTISFSARNLTSDITISVDNKAFSVSPTSLSAATANGTHPLTISYMPTEVGSTSATLTIASDGAEPVSVLLSGRCAALCTIAWMVSGSHYSAGDPTSSVADGGMPEVLPTAPTSCDPTRVFVGWSATSLTTAVDDVPEDLFSDASEAPVVHDNTIFHAVFAKQDGTVSQQIDFTPADFSGGVSGSGSPISTTKEDVTVAFSLGYATTEHVRSYTNGTITVSAETSITSIIVTAESDRGTNKLSTGVGEFTAAADKTTGTWNGSEASVTFTCSAQVRVTGVTVTTGGGVAYSSFITKLPCVSAPSAVEQTVQRPDAAEKVLIDGKLYIIRNNETYDIYGRR